MSDTESDSSIEPQEEEVVSKNVKIKRGKPTTIPKKRKKVITEIIEIESDDDLPNSQRKTQVMKNQKEKENIKQQVDQN